MLYAFRDAFGLKDVVEDIKATLRGEGMDYREFEPSEGFIHQGAGRDRRIRAGLRYSQGGKRKYWLPQTTPSTRPPATGENRVNRAIERFAGHDQDDEEVYAPLLPDQAANVVHTAPDLRSSQWGGQSLFDSDPVEDEGYSLTFGDIDEMDEQLFEHSKKYLFGDYHYPCVDVSTEAAKRMMWDEEERILRDERGAFFSPIVRPGRVLGQPRQSYGAMGNFQRSEIRERRDSEASDGAQRKGKARVENRPPREIVIDKEDDRLPEAQVGDVKLRWTSREHTPAQTPRLRTLSASARPAVARATSSSSSSGAGSPRNPKPPPSPRKETERPVLPPDAVDLVVEDPHAAEEGMTHERRKGEPAVRGGAGLHKVYRRGYVIEDGGESKEGEVEIEAGAAGTAADQDDSMFDVGDDVDSVLDAEEQAAEEATIATAETPPAHARTVLYSPEDLDDENPWA